MTKSASVYVLITGILVWFYGPRFSYLWEWSFGSKLELIGIAIFVIGGLGYLFESFFTRRNKTKKGDDMLKGLLIAIAGILVFLYGLAQSRLDGYPAFWSGMVLFAIGMFIFLWKFFKEYC